MNTDKNKAGFVRMERSYEASVSELWSLWTTKEGFESWWGPEGFRVKVHSLDLRVGGKLVYDMIAVGEAEIAYMKSAGMPLTHGTHGVFSAVEPMRRLSILHVIDFIPDVEAYDNTMTVEFQQHGTTATMVILVEPHRDENWTRMATMGMESQLTKIPNALVGMRK